MKRILLILSLIISLIAPVMADDLDMVYSIVNHLEYIGYSVYQNSNGLIAQKNDEAYIGIKLFSNGILLYTHWPIETNLQYIRVLSEINILNAQATLTRYYADNNNNLLIEVWLPSYYDRLAFGRLISTWQEETLDNVMHSRLFESYAENQVTVTPRIEPDPIPDPYNQDDPGPLQPETPPPQVDTIANPIAHDNEDMSGEAANQSAEPSQLDASMDLERAVIDLQNNETVEPTP